MANTYLRIILHVVFAVKNRDTAISPIWQSRLHGYFSQCLRNHGNYVHAIGGTPDHIHLLFDFNAKESLSDLMRDIKGGSSRFVNDNRLLPCRFGWQKGYAAFSYSPSQISKVKRYIENQYEHHKGVSFVEELKKVMEMFEIPYDPQYFFEEV